MSRSKATTGGSGAAAIREERRRQVWQLRRAGASQSEIARALGVSTATVAKDLKVIGEAIRAETIADAKAMTAFEVARLDAIQKSAWPLALGTPAKTDEKGEVVPAVPPDVAAIGAVRQIVESRAKLLGLYAPEAQDLQAQADYMAESFARAVEQELGPEGKGLLLRVMARWRSVLDAEGAKNGLAQEA